jgi:hypothetical protein
VKWNTGCTKYTFNQSIANPTTGILNQMDDSITKNDEFLSHQHGGKPMSTKGSDDGGHLKSK